MPLPKYNENGDLPEGVHAATLDEVVARFGFGSEQRVEVTTRLRRIFALASSTGGLDRLVVFGSYVSSKPEPNDVDVILVMNDEFRPTACRPDELPLFDHREAAIEFGASIFWIRPAMLLGQPIEDFITHWQIKRDGNRRGIVEVKL